MVQRTGGFRRKTRNKFTKSRGTQGKISIRDYLREFTAGSKVSLLAEPAVHKGMYHPRFHGLPATISKKRGSCYEVEVKDGKKSKSLIVHPVHLRARA